VVTVTLLVLLGLFVLWGVRTSPHRRFSWGMYSGSSKGFLWTTTPADPDAAEARCRPVRHLELGLAPESHLLNLVELHRLLAVTSPELGFDGLIIGSTGYWRIRYQGGDEGEGRLYAARVTPAIGHSRLVTAARELE
jgi:hypothetical protein